MEFLVAKLETGPGEVRLEITADYGANPMISDESDAKRAIRTVLRVGEKALEDLAPMSIEHRRAWDPAMPAYQEGSNHELLTGVWQWKGCPPEVGFNVPSGSPNDVLLWTTAEHLAGKGAKWMMLIAGDKTPPIVVKSKSRHWVLLTTAFGLMAIAALGFARPRRGTC
jgi:hypothetical protein